jgi:hypothetical protein
MCVFALKRRHPTQRRKGAKTQREKGRKAGIKGEALAISWN